MIIGKRGIKRIGEYYGYNPSIDATISNVFAASAFRFGHTMVNSVLTRLNENFEVITEGNLPLRSAFFAPWRIVQEGGVDPILRGLFSTATKLNTPTQVRRVMQSMLGFLFDSLIYQFNVKIITSVKEFK